jgi:hypothetical protein
VPRVTVKPLALAIVTVRVAGDPIPTPPKSTGFGVALIEAATIGRENALVPVHPSASEARTVNVNVPAAVGDPARTPAVDSESPVGTEPPGSTANVYGDSPPLAPSVREYGVLRMPAVRLPSIVIIGHAEAPLS